MKRQCWLTEKSQHQGYAGWEGSSWEGSSMERGPHDILAE